MPADANQKFWRVRPVPATLFEYAILATGLVDLGGNGRVDSFNSTNEMESTRGHYDPAKATDRAVIATASRAVNALNVGNMKIAGFVSTGPLATATVGPNGCVGSLMYLYNPANAGRIEPGHYRDAFQVVLPGAKLPPQFGPAYTPSAGSVNGTNYQFVLQNKDYRVSALSMSTGQKGYVAGRARLYVTGAISLSGTAYIVIPPSASLELYVGGTNAVISGTGIINSGNVTNFMYFGLPTNTNLTVSASATFVGTIYAPNAGVTLAGTNDAVGAVVAKTVRILGGMDFHFDESLKSAGPLY